MFQSTIPPTCPLKVNAIPWTFAMCVEHVIETNPQFKKSMRASRAGGRLLNAIEGRAEGEPFEWTDEDRNLLAEAFDEPACGWCPPLVIRADDGKETPIPVSPRVFYGYDETISPRAAVAVNGASAAAQPSPEVIASA